MPTTQVRHKAKTSNKKQKGGNQKTPISFLENTINYKLQGTQHSGTLSEIIDYNFLKFQNQSLNASTYINIPEKDLHILDNKKLPIPEYILDKDDDSYNAKFEMIFNDYNQFPAYKGINSLNLKISLPEQENAKDIAPKCFDITMNDLDTKFKQMIDSLFVKKIGKRIYKSDAVYIEKKRKLVNQAYIITNQNYILYLFFDKKIYNNEYDIECYDLYVSMNYIHLNTVNPDFDFAKSQLYFFEKYDTDTPHTWKLIFDGTIERLAISAIKESIVPNTPSINRFSLLEKDLTKHIFNLSTSMKVFSQKEMYTIVQKELRRNVLSRTRAMSQR